MPALWNVVILWRANSLKPATNNDSTPVVPPGLAETSLYSLLKSTPDQNFCSKRLAPFCASEIAFFTLKNNCP